MAVYNGSLIDSPDTSSGDEISTGSSLTNAYSTLLENREKDLFIISGTNGILTEDDTACNMNLRTAQLYKELNETIRKINISLGKLMDDEKNLDESIVKIHTAMLDIKGQCIVYSADLVDEFQKSHAQFYEEILHVQATAKNTIMTRKAILETTLDSMTRKQNALRPIILEGTRELIGEDAANKKLCAVCFDREVDTVMVPCGHTCCAGCSNYHKSTKCMQCRATIQKTIKIYFSV